jgi:hypothetical protein
MCVDRTVDSFSCHAFHAGKEAVFSAMYNDKRIVIKSATQEVPHDIFFWIDHSPESYPTEDEFVRMIQHRVNSRYLIFFFFFKFMKQWRFLRETGDKGVLWLAWV